MRKQIITSILLSIAKEIGLNILVEPTVGMYGTICFENGRKWYFKDVNFNINLTASTSLAKNKAATSFFLEHFGYNVPEFTMVYSDEKCARIKSTDNTIAGLNYAKLIGFPVILKPNNMSQGNFVFKANNENQYFSFALEIFKNCDMFQVQKFYYGNDYRIVVLDKRILSVYQRVPLNITGNGCSTISELIDIKQTLFISNGRDTKLRKEDIRITNKLLEQGLSLETILPQGQKVFLQDISNLSAGGETIELTDKIHPSFAELALKIANDMNLTLCGIDIIANDIMKSSNNEYIIIEINSSPGLDNYAYEGVRQENYVKMLYKEILMYIKNTYL